MNKSPCISGLIISLVFLTLSYCPKSAFAAENYQEGSVIFSDDFNSGKLDTQKWVVESGKWSVDGTKQLLGFDFGVLKAGRINANQTWDNYRLEIDVRNYSGVDEGIGFRRSDNNNNYEIGLRHGTGQYNTPEIVLGKMQDGTYSRIFSTHDFPLVNNVTYHVKVEVVDEHIQVWIDGTLVIDLTDTGTKVKTGPISLSYWTGDRGADIVRFDNVKVTSLNKQLFPVIFIPGIGGSELKASSHIYWADKDNGHGGTYTRTYTENEKIWVNTDEAIKLGDDDYFDVLRMKPDGITSEANISTTGNLVSEGYSDIDPFFQEI